MWTATKITAYSEQMQVHEMHYLGIGKMLLCKILYLVIFLCPSVPF